MIERRSKRWLRRAVLAAVATSGLTVSWAVERQSVERANRLHRDGALRAAAALYGARLSRRQPDPSIRYNLGTSLLELGNAAAPGELEAGTGSPDGDIRARAHYNAGLFSLRRALEGDSVRTYATASVESNRAALRIRPDHAETKWNLAMAQRLLDSIDASERRSGRETAESALEADEIVRSENVLDVDEENELPEEAPMEGEEEARADAEAEEPLSRLEAAEILTTTHLDPTLMVRKLLALESRSHWGRRLRRALTPRR
jgi:hypothetical protein